MNDRCSVFVSYLSVLALVAILMPGCAFLNQVKGGMGAFAGGGTGGLGDFKKPDIRVTKVVLKQAPNNREMAGYLCRKQVPGVICSLMGLRAPEKKRLSFAFEIQLEVKNNSALPIPAVEVLTGFTAYPDEGHKNNLGSLCVALCPAGESCTQPRKGKCKASTGDISTLAGFGRAVAGFLVAAAAGEVSASDLKIKTIAPGATIPITVGYRLGIDPALDLVKRASNKAMETLKARQMPQFQIPYAIAGKVFFDVKKLGRIAIKYGPVKGTWNLK